MSHQPSNNRYQPLSLYTQSPIRLDYHRALPPLADHPVLELRRPANKDACFAVSALSPNMSKRFGGDWDAMTGRTSLLDRYLGQQAISPVAQELPRSFNEQAPRSPVTPAHANVPANSKALWALMSQTNSQKTSSGQKAAERASQKPTDDRASQAASAAQRRRRERGPPPPPPHPVALSSTRSRDDQGRRRSPPVTSSSTRAREDHERNSSLPAVPKSSPPREDFSGRVSPPNILSSIQTREEPVRRASPPGIPASTRPRNDREGRDTMVHRLEGFPIPRALSVIQDNPRPFTNMDSTVSLTSGLEQLGRESSFSRIDSWIGPPLTENMMSTRGRDAPRYPGLPPAPSAKLKSYVPKIKTVRFADIASSRGSSLMSPTFLDSERGHPSPSPTTFSPITPVAMTFEYPAIFESTPPLEQVPWDDDANELDAIENSPQDSILSVMTSKAIIESPARGRLDPRDAVHVSRPRARSLSPPRTPFPGESPLQPLPTTIYTPIDQSQASKRAAKDDFDLTYDVSEPIKDGVRLLDRTAIWVLSGRTKDTTERKQIISLSSVGNDREAILKSYFHRF
ncbi:hypothetical protein FKW77_003194 [Venturia effusa]|uniref:Uncharacterized protein n=1 Tax=Venturia effusa TaxID=50376 RepID=A0A517L100_9PEZI|nr:hypothetical protein FKW77_003194 [Venturia effusa]